jgi:hypothetical protein
MVEQKGKAKTAFPGSNVLRVTPSEWLNPGQNWLKGCFWGAGGEAFIMANFKWQMVTALPNVVH